MKIFLTPTGLHSRAMIRVVEALRQYAPSGVEFVGKPQDADVRVVHAIAPFSVEEVKSKEFVIIQYCLGTTGQTDWSSIWDKARFVWSYYDLRDKTGKTPFYFAPLGVDASVFQIKIPDYLRGAVMTSGFTTGAHAEPIEETVNAAESVGLPIIHLGPPKIEGMKNYPKHWQTYLGINDHDLVTLYNNSKWVSGMRFIEGFEMPVIEGLACGARPICFDRPDMRQWYNGNVVFVPECHNKELQDILVSVLQTKPKPVTKEERESIVKKFDWKPIADGFWKQMNV